MIWVAAPHLLKVGAAVFPWEYWSNVVEERHWSKEYQTFLSTNDIFSKLCEFHKLLIVFCTSNSSISIKQLDLCF